MTYRSRGSSDKLDSRKVEEHARKMLESDDKQKEQKVNECIAKAARILQDDKQKLVSTLNMYSRIYTVLFVISVFTRDSIICYSAYMPRQFRLSVRPSVCPSVCHTRVLYQNG